MIRRVPIFLLGGKWRYIDGHLQWEMYLIHSTPILLDVDPKTFQRIWGGVNRSSSAPIFGSPCQSPNHIDTSYCAICRPNPFLSSQSCTISVITELHHIVITLSSYCNWCLWYHVISYWYHHIDTTHFCHHRVAPFLSSQSCTILSSYCHHIVIDVFDTMLYHIDTTLYVDSTHLCHHRVASYCHHIIIILSSYYLWRPHVVHYICHHRITPYCHIATSLISCNQPTQSWRPLIKLSGCYPFCASIIVRRKHIWEL